MKTLINSFVVALVALFTVSISANAQNKNGKITVSPHEYGTYSYKDGKYTECGRDGGPINFTGKDNFNGHWSNITEYWNRNPKFPSDLRNLIVSKCKIVLGDKNQKNQILLKEYVLYDKK